MQAWTALPQGATRSAAIPDGRAISISVFAEQLRLRTAEAIAYWPADDRLFGRAPAVSRNVLGRGACWYVGGYLGDSGAAEVLRWIVTELGILSAVDAPPQVEAIVRSSGNRRFFALLNHSPDEQTVRGLPPGRDWVADQKSKVKFNSRHMA